MDWIGESKTGNEPLGFKSRGGRKPETTGIWMWSEIFTHDFENGEKVAIILLDTQGLFDTQSTLKDCTVTFTLSMLLSSVQCYNLMSNIKEDDLTQLELFIEYARAVQQQTYENPFQYLLFIVRDWPNVDETGGFGWNGEKVIEEVLAKSSVRTPEMHQLRERIQTSFDEISAYLMPHPGLVVANGRFKGDSPLIDPEFRQYVKELVPSLLAPENLIMKTVNGKKLRARDLVQYLESTKAWERGIDYIVQTSNRKCDTRKVPTIHERK